MSAPGGGFGGPTIEANQRVRVSRLEVATHGYRAPTDDDRRARLQERQQLLQQIHERERAAAKQAGVDVDEELDDDETDPMAPEDLQRYLEAEVVIPVPRSQLRTRPHVIERQIEPLVHAMQAGNLTQARDQVLENLHSLGVFASASSMQPVQLQVMLTEDPSPFRPDNPVRPVTATSLSHPTLLERMAGRVSHTLRGAAATLGIADGIEGDDDEQEGDFALGGLIVPSRLQARPLKLTVVLPPEKRMFSASINANTAGTINTSDVGMDINMRNALGFGECASLQLKQGVDSSSLLDIANNSVHVSATVPELLTRRSSSTLQLSIDRQHMPDSSLMQVSQGASMVWAPYSGRHRIKYEVALRRLHALSAKLPEDQQPVPAPMPVDSQRASASSSWSSWLPWGRRQGQRSRAPSVVAPSSAAPPSASDALVCPSARWREPSESVLSMVAGGAGLGHSLKSSLQYSYSLRSRHMDDSANPTQGWCIGATGEYAGVGGVGDARFVRVEGDGKSFWRVPLLPRSWGVSVGVGGLAQYVHNLSPATSRVFMGDRLLLGSSLTLRGLPVNTCGPRDGQDVLGGELAVATAAHLGFNLRPSVRGHLFWNAGNMLGLHNDTRAGEPAAASGQAGTGPATQRTLPRASSALPHLADALIATSRQSVGVGISCSFGGARFELHCAHPISKQPQDNMQNRWPIQFGFGLQWV